MKLHEAGTVGGADAPEPRHPGRVTRDDVAALAGVSSATVSYVVNGGPRPVSAEAHARVMAAIHQLGYHPDAIARSLRARRSRALGLVMPDNTNVFFAELARQVEHAAHERGYSLLLANSQEDLDRARDHLAFPRDRRVDGIVLVPADAPGGNHTASIDGIPILALDRFPPGWDGDAVQTDGRAGGLVAVEHLVALGHREIGFIHGPLRLAHACDRLQGGLDALGAAGLPANSRWQRSGDFDFAGGKAAALDVLRGSDRPTALCCSNDALAIGVLAAAYELGLRVPDQLSITGFDDVPVAAYTVPPLTTVAQPYLAMASAALELMLARVEQAPAARESAADPLPPRRRVLPVHLVVRGSTTAAGR